MIPCGGWKKGMTTESKTAIQRGFYEKEMDETAARGKSSGLMKRES